MLFTFSETSNFDDAPKWDEAQRETVNRNLSIEFDAENTTHETDTTDDASAINRNQKFNQSKVCFLQINWDNGAKYLIFFSCRSLKTREKYISFAQLVLLRLYIF